MFKEKTVAIKCFINGKYVSVSGNRPIFANSSQISKNQTFDMIEINGQAKEVAFRSHANGKFVCSEDRGRKPLVANRNAALEWETFKIVPNEDGVSFKAKNCGRFVCAEHQGKNALIANRGLAKTWEKFYIINLDSDDQSDKSSECKSKKKRLSQKKEAKNQKNKSQESSEKQSQSQEQGSQQSQQSQSQDESEDDQ